MICLWLLLRYSPEHLCLNDLNLQLLLTSFLINIFTPAQPISLKFVGLPSPSVRSFFQISGVECKKSTLSHLTDPDTSAGLLLGPRKQLLIEFVRSKTIYRSAKIHLELNVQDQGKTCKNFGKERRQWQSETPNIAK